jgi:hypothetical protein
MNRWLLSILLILAGAPAGAAVEDAAGQQPMTYVYNRSLSSSDEADHYIWNLLDTALRRTRPDYGDYQLLSAPPMPTERRAYVVANGLEGVNVAILDPNPGREEHLLPVRIPLDRGLLGYRVLLIDAEDQPRFSAVAKTADLADFRFGLLPWWDDATIMRAVGFQVIPGASYEGLFQMLAARRFDAFSRGVGEVLAEYKDRKPSMPSLAVERHLLFHYPMPIYFWFRDDEAGRRRAERVRAGLEQMVADGTLKKMFDAEFGPSLAQLDLAHRLVIELPNPLLDPALLPADPVLWFRP